MGQPPVTAILGTSRPTDRTGGHDLGLVHRHPRPCNRATMTGVRQLPRTAGITDAANLSARCDGRH